MMISTLTATSALQQFKHEFLILSGIRSNLIDHLVPFIIDKFDMDLDPNCLPDHFLNESEEETQLRTRIMERLMAEFSLVYPNFDRHKDEDIFSTVIYWRLRDCPRTPSNYNREPSKNTVLNLPPMDMRRLFVASSLSRRLPQIEQFVVQEGSGDMLIHQTSSEDEFYCDTDHNIFEEEQVSTDEERFAEYDEIHADYRAQSGSREHLHKAKTSQHPIEVPLRITNLGTVNRTDILLNLLGKLGAEYGGRYGDFLTSETGRNTSTVLEDALTSAVRDICTRGSFDLQKYFDFAAL